jgi:hypothetical protein
MLKKTTCVLVIFLISMLCFQCQKDAKPVTGFTEEDTTSNSGPVVRKPNIYIYPVEKIDLMVRLKFPHGGKVLDSTPHYSDGWNIQVEPSGLINNQYQYLFYEARIPERLQRESGWIIAGKDLENFFRQNLRNLSFSEKEISDFIDYWIPLLDADETYIIYPHYSEELSGIIDIYFSIPPDNVIRVFYLIEAYTGDENVRVPQIPEYSRDGFTVLEWGVVYQ